MKPKPFSALNHFTVPVAISRSSAVCGPRSADKPQPGRDPQQRQPAWPPIDEPGMNNPGTDQLFRLGCGSGVCAGNSRDEEAQQRAEGHGDGGDDVCNGHVLPSSG